MIYFLFVYIVTLTCYGKNEAHDFLKPRSINCFINISKTKRFSFHENSVCLHIFEGFLRLNISQLELKITLFGMLVNVFFPLLFLVLKTLNINGEINSYYKNLRILSTSRGISIQMDGTVLYIKRNAY